MNTNELIIDTVNAEADRTADSTEQVGAEISTDPSTAGDIEAVTTDNSIEVEEGIDGNAEPDLEAVPDLLEAEGATGTDSGIDVEAGREEVSVAGTKLVDEGDTESGGQTVESRHSARIQQLVLNHHCTTYKLPSLGKIVGRSQQSRSRN